MQGNHLFEYAVIRLVPQVEREEFLNVGVVLYCASQEFLQIRYRLDEERLSVFCKQLNIPETEKYLLAFSRICTGGEDAGPIGRLPIAERFRWLTATRSTVVQASGVHPGFCAEAGETLQNLFETLVL